MLTCSAISCGDYVGLVSLFLCIYFSWLGMLLSVKCSSQCLYVCTLSQAKIKKDHVEWHLNSILFVNYFMNKFHLIWSWRILKFTSLVSGQILCMCINIINYYAINILVMTNTMNTNLGVDSNWCLGLTQILNDELELTWMVNSDVRKDDKLLKEERKNCRRWIVRAKEL